MAALLLLPPVVGAQVVRGSVLVEPGGAPIRGAVVTLLDGRGQPAGRRAVTDEAGTYAMRAPGPGNWAVEARAIGYARQRTLSRNVGAGETVVVNFAMRRAITRLATLRVEGRSACRRAAELDSIASPVWDDIWAALVSNDAAREQRLLRADVFVYTREVHVASGRVTWEERGVAPVLDERPFRTAPAAELMKQGFWRQSVIGNVEFYGIDAGTIISPEFLETHCFSLARTDSSGVVRVGLSFRPVRSRAADVQGVLWVDAESRELRQLDFTYTGLQLRGPAAGGTISFSRLPSGITVDDSWKIQHPFDQPRVPGNQRTGRGEGGDASSRDATTLRIAGGFLLTDAARASQFAVVAGQVVGDAAPADATTVEILGGGQRAEPDSSGSFLLRDVLPGTYEMRLLRAGTDEDGGFVQHGRLVLAGGDAARVRLDVPDAASITSELCPGQRDPTRGAALFGVLRHVESSRPAANIPVELQWEVEADSPGGQPGRSGAARVLSDWRGEFVACDLPPRAMVRFRTTSRDAEWSQPLRGARLLRVIEVAVDTSAVR